LAGILGGKNYSVYGRQKIKRKKNNKNISIIFRKQIFSLSASMVSVK